MPVVPPAEPARPSLLIAEALVQRHGPKRIAERASCLGLSPALTKVVVVACSAAAIEPPRRLPLAR